MLIYKSKESFAFETTFSGRHYASRIPEDIIRRRYSSGLEYFSNLYRPLVDEWSLYENPGPTPVLIEESINR